MAQTFTLVLLSGTPASGRVIPIAAVATPGTLIHTAIAGANAVDELQLFVSNVTAAAAKITIEWGGVTAPGDHLVHSVIIPPNAALMPIVPGLCINGGLIVRAYSDVASALNVSGQVLRVQ